MNSPRSNENDDLDNEIGVLMAYGGKLLRRLGSFALEFILQTPSTTSNEKVTGITFTLIKINAGVLFGIDYVESLS